MTPQEIFDSTAEWLLARQAEGKGRVGAIDDRGNFKCRYRSANGEGCAVGRLISNEDYRPEMEGNIWEKVVWEGRAAHLPSWFTTHSNLLKDLQAVHDDYFNWESKEAMVRSLKLTAQAYDLHTWPREAS